MLPIVSRLGHEACVVNGVADIPCSLVKACFARLQRPEKGVTTDGAIVRGIVPKLLALGTVLSAG